MTMVPAARLPGAGHLLTAVPAARLPGAGHVQRLLEGFFTAS
jgi:hypothetical protein